MKTKNIILSILVGTWLFTGCSDGFDALNSSPNGLTDDQYSFARSDLGVAIRNGANYNYTVDAVLQGGADIQQRMKALGIDAFVQYGTGSTASSTYTQNDGWQAKIWHGHYISHLWPLNGVIEGAEMSIDTETNIRSIALIWRVYVQARFTDYFGPAPFPRVSEDEFPDYMPLDKQYDLFFQDIDDAMKGFDSSKPTIDTEPIYAGNLTKWKQFANTLRLRLALTISEINPELCKAQIQAAVQGDSGLIQSGGDASTGSYSGWGNQYPYYMYIVDWGERNYLLTTTMEKIMTNIGGIAYGGTATGSHPAKIDPRGSKMFDPSPTGSNWKGRKPGMNPVPADLTPTISGMSRLYIVADDTRKAQLETYPETCFLMAEASERFGITGGKSAKQWYEEGVKASLTEWGYNENDIKTYLASVDKNGWGTSANYDDATGAGNTKLEKIISQKYIACYPDLANQMWNDKRRLNLPAMDLPEFRDTGAGDFPTDNDIHNPFNFIQRTVFPQSEVQLNKEKYDAGIALMEGGDKASSPLWWASKKSNYCTSAK